MRTLLIFNKILYLFYRSNNLKRIIMLRIQIKYQHFTHHRFANSYIYLYFWFLIFALDNEYITLG